ncbi:uncharacterized protein Z519_01150 [Cladophialophora bantiana CBS 173.52]|uniref:Uncharacterized protein n=1 Tax=Cladophialophora bantiana (strain ATCC 10958 / CBS 173.52 / CDC B-1940 / NIH 8579) TaxID=1442370 RepID=A0A0D2F5V0_CLAB1|nr:uncharacterized protein Z519_01150 [Cladophialophora bantiana CBS 173.52]KIW97566.1 hypothetical protein Z519_01150 [Cladophialophora bantiana CBS 173.52]
MSRNRFRVKLESRDEPGPSAKDPSNNAGAPPPTLESHIRIFSNQDQGDWILRKRKVRAPRRRRSPGTPAVAKQGNSPEDGQSSSMSPGRERVKEAESTTKKGRKGRPRDSAKPAADPTKTIPPSVPAQERQSSSSSADSILDNLDSHPHPLTAEEQNFVIKWLQFQAQASWSNTAGAFCPCRDIAWRGIQMYPAGGLPWTLIFCDMFLAWSRRQPLPDRLHRRKALAYKYIAKLLADPKTQASDEALLCVCLAMSADARSLSPEVNRIHLKGLAQMIGKRGVGSLFSTVCFMFHPMFSLAYFSMAELEASNMVDVQSATERFLETLHSMQQDGRRSQSEDLRCQRTDSRSSMVVSSSLWSVAMGKSTIHHVVKGILANPQRRSLPIQQDLALFLNLYLLNLILWDLLEWPDTAATFLQKLSLHADNARVRVEITVWLLAKSWVDADETSNRTGGGAKKEVFLTEAVIDALKTFSRITDESKDKLAIVLSSWLFGCGDEEREGGGPESTAAAPEESSCSPGANSAASHIAATTDGTTKPAAPVSAPTIAADVRPAENDIDPKVVSPRRQQVRGTAVDSKLCQCLSSQDFKVMMEEACSDWYEKNVSKRPMPPVPMISLQKQQQEQQQRRRREKRK